MEPHLAVVGGPDLLGGLILARAATTFILSVLLYDSIVRHMYIAPAAAFRGLLAEDIKFASVGTAAAATITWCRSHGIGYVIVPRRIYGTGFVRSLLP